MICWGYVIQNQRSAFLFFVPAERLPVILNQRNALLLSCQRSALLSF